MLKIALTVVLAAALAGCASVRRGLGEYQKAADKGVNIGGPPGGGPAAAEVSSGGPSAPTSGRGKSGPLPAGLGGDKVHPDYTTSPQR